MTLRETIATRRKELGMSQADLADKAGLHKQYISKIERGTLAIKEISTLCHLESALQVQRATLYILICGDTQPQP